MLIMMMLIPLPLMPLWEALKTNTNHPHLYMEVFFQIFKVGFLYTCKKLIYIFNLCLSDIYFISKSEVWKGTSRSVAKEHLPFHSDL